MKKSVFPLFAFLFLMLIGFISATSFSLSSMLDSIEASTLLIFVVFIVSFALIFFSLSKTVFKQNNTIAAIISLAASFLITYGINKIGFDLGDLFSNIGISEEILYIILPILALALIIFLVVKLKKNSPIARWSSSPWRP